MKFICYEDIDEKRNWDYLPLKQIPAAFAEMECPFRQELRSWCQRDSGSRHLSNTDHAWGNQVDSWWAELAAANEWSQSENEARCIFVVLAVIHRRKNLVWSSQSLKRHSSKALVTIDTDTAGRVRWYSQKGPREGKAQEIAAGLEMLCWMLETLLMFASRETCYLGLTCCPFVKEAELIQHEMALVRPM